MDDELLTHPEILVCVEPPLDLAVGPAIAVRRILRAEQISHG
jgi:hypothetical protein